MWATRSIASPPATTATPPSGGGSPSPTACSIRSTSGRARCSPSPNRASDVTVTAGISQGPHITIDGSPMGMALYDDLVDVRVDRQVTVASQFTLRFHDPDF